MHKLLFTVIVGFAAVLPASGQARWTQLTPNTVPIARIGAAAAGGFSDFLVFGGDKFSALGSVHTNELWRFDGQDWSLLTTTGLEPTPRAEAAAAFDLFRNRLVVFGGRIPARNFDEIWEWDGSSWTGPAVTPRPPARNQAAMAFETHRARTILFGGVDRMGNLYDDTWAWNGTAFTQIVTASAPSARRGMALVYDSRRGNIVLFGGSDANGALGDTWIFDGQDWVRASTPTVPYGTGCWGHSMVYDQARERVVLFGGTADGQQRLDGTWEFDGTDWRRRQPANPPGQRIAAGMAYVLGTRATYLFGGSSPGILNDTWKYQTDALATFQTVGAGCPGSFGTAGLSMPDLPWIGEDYVLEVERVPAGAATVIVAGFQTTNLPLDVLGAPGCVVTADPLATAVLPIAPGTGLPTLTLPIPAYAGLIGGTLHAQAVIYEPTGGGRFSVSPRGDAVFGAL